MPLNRDFVGRAYDSDETFEVSREHIRQFAEAIGDPNPAYRDREAAAALGHPDVIAPPTFMMAAVLRLSGEGPLSDPELGIDLGLVVHGEQRFVHHRPARPGDTLRARTVVADIRDAGRNELMTLRTDVTTADGELVCESHNLIVSRGTAASS